MNKNWQHIELSTFNSPTSLHSLDERYCECIKDLLKIVFIQVLVESYLIGNYSTSYFFILMFSISTCIACIVLHKVIFLFYFFIFQVSRQLLACVGRISLKTCRKQYLLIFNVTFVHIIYTLIIAANRCNTMISVNYLLQLEVKKK